MIPSSISSISLSISISLLPFLSFILLHPFLLNHSLTPQLSVPSTFYHLLTPTLRPDTSRVFVNVGLGFHVEFTLPEAIEFIDKKEAVLTKYYHLLSLNQSLPYPPPFSFTSLLFVFLFFSFLIFKFHCCYVLTSK